MKKVPRIISDAFIRALKKIISEGYLFTEFESFSWIQKFKIAVPLRRNGNYFALVIESENYFGIDSVCFNLYQIKDRSMLYTRIVRLNNNSCFLVERLESWIGQRQLDFFEYEYKKVV